MKPTPSKPKWLNLSRLPKAERQATWERMQQQFPDQAALCTDPLVMALRQQFKAELVIELPEGWHQ